MGCKSWVSGIVCVSLATGCSIMGKSNAVVPSSVSGQIANNSASAGAPGSSEARIDNEDRNRWLAESEGVSWNAKMITDFGSLMFYTKDLEGGIRVFRKAIKEDKTYLPAYIALAKCYVGQHQPDKALEVLEEAKKKCKHTAPVYNEIALIHARASNFPSAIAAARKAVELEPESEVYVRNLAGMLAVTGVYAESFELYRRYVPAAEAHYIIAGVQFSQNRHDLSMQNLHAAIKADPKHEKSVEMLKSLRNPQVQDSSVRPAGYVSEPLGR